MSDQPANHIRAQHTVNLWMDGGEPRQGRGTVLHHFIRELEKA